MTVEELQIVISSRTEAAMSKIKGLKNAMANLTPKKASDVNVSTSKSQRELKKLQSELDRTQRKIDTINQKMAPLFAQQDTIINKYLDTPAFPNMTQDESIDFMVNQDPQMRKLNAQLDKLDAQMVPLKAHLAETKTRIAQLGQVATPAASKIRLFGDSTRIAGRHIQNAGQHSSYFARMVKSMLLSMALYSGISLIIKSITEGLQNMAQGSDTANKTMSQLATSALYAKNSIVSAFLPALQAIEPVLVNVANSIANFMTIIGMFTARLFGNATTFTRARQASVDYAKTLGGVSKAAKTAKGSLAAFDEINTLSSNNSSSATSGMPQFTNMFEQVPIPNWVNTIADKIKSTIAYITSIISGALLFIGTLLVLSGADIPLGIGLMVAGAAGLAATIAANWNSMPDTLRNVLTAILAGFAGFELALGAILAFSGANIPLGIGLMILGVGSLATAIALNWNNLGDSLSSTIIMITGVVSGATLALGALFAFSGANIPLGIGLMLVGAAGLASMVALNWNGLSAQMREQISTITAIVSVSLLALGAILTFTGVAIPLGIGMLLVGAATLASVVALNWNAIPQKVKNTLSDILTIASAASIALGIILCLTGAGIPLGIGLILAGIGGMFTAASIGDSPIITHIKNVMNSIIGIIETGVNFCIYMLNQLSWDVPSWVPGIGGSKFGFNIGYVHLPRLATGGVIKGATPLIAGEAGAEAIVPLERNTKWIDSLADRIASRTENTDKNIAIPIYLDGRLVYEVVKRHAARDIRNNNKAAFV